MGLHRRAWCIANDAHPADIVGKVIRHKCDNPRCINPEHLEPGSYKDNMQDMKERGRERKLRGQEHARSKLTEEQVAWVRENYKPRDKQHGCRAMARKLGVYHHVISRIVNGVGY